MSGFRRRSSGFFWAREEEESLYKVGDKVVYPHHGAGTVVKKEKRTILGTEREYLTIKILHNDMTVNVPAENAEKVGLRPVVDEDMVEQVLEVLHGSGTKMPKNWNRRFKHNRDKMKTGDIFELAEVVRNLSLRDQGKGSGSRHHKKRSRGQSGLRQQGRHYVADEPQHFLREHRVALRRVQEEP